MDFYWAFFGYVGDIEVRACLPNCSTNYQQIHAVHSMSWCHWWHPIAELIPGHEATEEVIGLVGSLGMMACASSTYHPWKLTAWDFENGPLEEEILFFEKPLFSGFMLVLRDVVYLLVKVWAGLSQVLECSLPGKHIQSSCGSTM